MNQMNLMQSLEYATLAYEEIQPCAYGERLISIDGQRTGVQCYIRISGDTFKIAFRGTDSCMDWATDFRFWKMVIPYNNRSSEIRVHAGFISAYKNPEIRKCIHHYLSEDIRRVQVTGHSYGAALAILCAVDLQYNFPQKDYEAALFGCPRVGNRAFKISYNKRVPKTLRVENGNDVVTKVPPPILGFRHVGTPLHIGPPRQLGIISFRDHHPACYLEALQRLNPGKSLAPAGSISM